MMRRLTLIVAALVSVLLWPQVGQAASCTKTVRYGPFDLPSGTATDPGMIHNQLFE